MLYLEDYLEMIEHLPQELRDRFTEMREMDLQVQNSMDSLEDRTRHLFCNAKKLKTDQRDVEYDKIRQDYYKSLEDADEKVHMASQMYDLVDKYLRRLDQELQKFKMELEADNAGITEILEKRSLELDNPLPLMSTANSHKPRPEKRKYIAQNSYSSANGSDKRVEKALNSFATEIVQEPQIKYRTQSSSIAHPSASTSPFSSNHGSPVPSTPQPSLSYNLGHMGAGSNAIAAAASQAIAATQQMQQGRRTASLKASFQVINSGLNPTFNKELTLGREVGVVSGSGTGIGGTNGGVASGNVANNGAASVLGGNSSGNTVTTTSNTSGPSVPTGLAPVPPSISPIPEIKTGRQKKQSKSNHVIVLPAEPPVISPEECQVVNTLDESGQPVDWSFDPNEPRYCICNQVSYGDMVACDNEDCPVEWFHYNCVGITQPPRGKWYCPQCTAAMRRRGRKDK